MSDLQNLAALFVGGGGGGDFVLVDDVVCDKVLGTGKKEQF
jgi:hypothetical protein